MLPNLKKSLNVQKHVAEPFLEDLLKSLFNGKREKNSQVAGKKEKDKE